MIGPVSIVLLGLACSFVRAVGPLVNVDYSEYQGTALPNGVSQWLGVRFAAPPVGTLRFRAPADPLQNKTVQVAAEVRPALFAKPAQPSTNVYLARAYMSQYRIRVSLRRRIRRLPLPRCLCAIRRDVVLAPPCLLLDPRRRLREQLEP